MMFLNFLLWKRESVKVIRMNFLKSYVYLHCSSSIALNTMYGIPSILFDFVHNGMCTKKSIEAMRQLIANTSYIQCIGYRRLVIYLYCIG